MESGHAINSKFQKLCAPPGNEEVQAWGSQITAYLRSWTLPTFRDYGTRGFSISREILCSAKTTLQTIFRSGVSQKSERVSLGASRLTRWLGR